MGTSSSPAELAGKLGRLTREYQDLPRTLVNEASLATKTSIKAVAPARLRGVGRRGAKLDVRYNVAGQGESVKALVFALGPWQLIEGPTAPHRIPRERTRGKRRYAVIPGLGVFSSAQHPGTHGQHSWRKGVEAAKPVVTRLFYLQGAVPLRKVFS